MTAGREIPATAHEHGPDCEWSAGQGEVECIDGFAYRAAGTTHERGEFVPGLGWSCVTCDTFGCPGVAPTDAEIAEALGYTATDQRGDPTRELAGPAPRLHIVQRYGRRGGHRG